MAFVLIWEDKMTSIISDFSPPLRNNGELLIGSTNDLPVVNTLTPGSGITITNGPGSITISSSSSSNPVVILPDPTASTTTLTANTTFIATNSSGGPNQFILPTSPNPGDFYEVVGAGALGWVINQNASQQILIGPISTTAGLTGILAATEIDGIARCSVLIRCVTATIFIVTSIIGQLLTE